jgi:hypothetical protein
MQVPVIGTIYHIHGIIGGMRHVHALASQMDCRMVKSSWFDMRWQVESPQIF